MQAKLDGSPDAPFAAGVVRTFTARDLADGTLAHMGMGLINGGVTERVRPRPEMGPYSKKNREGWEVVRRDLPMVTKTFSFDTPNFGDWSHGSHTVSVDREVYQRDYFDPPDFDLLVQSLRTGSDGNAVFKVVVDFLLDRISPDFGEDLLFAILPQDAAHDELLSTLDLAWEVFPPGTVDEVVRRTLRGLGRPRRRGKPSSASASRSSTAFTRSATYRAGAA